VEARFTDRGDWAAPADPISRHCPELPGALADVVMRALERTADARFETMDDVARAFAPYAAAPATPNTVSRPGSRRARAWRALAVTAAVVVAGAAIVWRAARAPQGATCSYELLADTTLDPAGVASIPREWTAGAAGPSGVAIVAGGPGGALRVLADPGGVSVRPLDLGDLGPLAGVDTRWLAGEPHAFTLHRFADGEDARVLVDFPFALDRFQSSARIGGRVYCRHLLGQPDVCPYQLRATHAGFDDDDSAPGAFAPVGVTEIAENDGVPSIRVFGRGWQGSTYFVGKAGGRLESVEVDGAGASAAIAFLYDAQVYVGRLRDERGPRALGRKADHLALSVDGDTLHVLFSDGGHLTHVRWSKRSEPEVRTASAVVGAPTTLHLAARGERLWATWLDGGRAAVGSGGSVDELVRDAAHVTESLPRDGPWVSAGARDAIVVWLEDGPLRVRRALARCPSR
jgi:hypothetical protein